ncbi:MAG: cation diffusion facilitator family transporter [Caldimicrobium sp.]
MEHFHSLESKALKLTGLSLFISLLIFLLKFLAYLLTGSVAIYSDALESIVNIFSALLAFIGSRISLKPSDAEHPYGHTKVEYLIAILEALFILTASISIIWKAYQRFLSPEEISSLEKGLALILLASLLNGLLSYKIYRQGKKENSPILISHAAHLFTDVITTAGIILGIIIAKLSNFWYLDPLLAILVGLNISYLGYKILKESVNSLLDVRLSEEKTQSIHQIIQSTISQSKIQEADYHDFKSRRAGRKSFVEFHLTVPGKTSVEEAHNLCDEIEKNIQKTHPEIHVTIHLEPSKEKSNKN